MWKTLRRLGLTVRNLLHAAEQQRKDVAQARQDWAAQQGALDIQHCVFLDETWATTNMTRLYGRALRGQRCVGQAPHGH